MKTAFGWVEVDGIRYDHDIVIHTDKSVDKRSKKKSKKYRQQYGHTPLSDNELNFVKKEKPEVVFIGTGQYGDLPVTKDAQKILSKYNTVVLPTPEIVERLRDEGRPFSAVLHVTC